MASQKIKFGLLATSAGLLAALGLAAAAWACVNHSLKVDPARGAPGQTITVSGTDWALGGSDVSIYLVSPDGAMADTGARGKVTAGRGFDGRPRGEFSTTFTVPAAMAAGGYHVIAEATEPGGRLVRSEPVGFQVMPATAPRSSGQHSAAGAPNPGVPQVATSASTSPSASVSRAAAPAAAPAVAAAPVPVLQAQTAAEPAPRTVSAPVASGAAASQPRRLPVEPAAGLLALLGGIALCVRGVRGRAPEVATDAARYA